MMRSRWCVLLLGALFSVSVWAIDPLPFADGAEEARFKRLSEELRCLVCQNQNLADSDASLARDLRAEVFELMRSGKSDDEIKQFLVARYGDFVLYRPPVKPLTWVLWFGPAALALGAVIVVIRIARRRARQLPADAQGVEDLPG